MERALDRADVILEIYRTVSTVNHPAGWLPISVICENCGRLAQPRRATGTARRFRTSAAPTWSSGRPGVASEAASRHLAAAPRWSGTSTGPHAGGLVGATIEGCGKDLATAGGSRDRADAISRRVFDREPPLNIPYEFLNIGGRKMSTSRGEGAAAHEIAEILPPTLHALPVPAPQTQQGDRLRPIRRHDPAPVRRVRPDRRRGRGQPAARRAAARPGADLRPVAGGCRRPIRGVEAARFRPPFAHLALLLQVPGPDIMDRLAAEKGAPLDDAEQDVALERIAAAEKWLEVAGARLGAGWRSTSTRCPPRPRELTDAQTVVPRRPVRRRRAAVTRRRRGVAVADLRHGTGSGAQAR